MWLVFSSLSPGAERYYLKFPTMSIFLSVLPIVSVYKFWCYVICCSDSNDISSSFWIVSLSCLISFLRIQLCLILRWRLLFPFCWQFQICLLLILLLSAFGVLVHFSVQQWKDAFYVTLLMWMFLLCIFYCILCIFCFCFCVILVIRRV